MSFATGRQDSLRAPHGRPAKPLRQPKRGHYPAFGDGRILAAVYFFIVKPTLDTTKDISHEVNVNVQKGFESANLGEIDRTIEDVNRQVEIEIKQSFHASKQQGDADKLIRCIKHAHQNVNRIQRCSERFQ